MAVAINTRGSQHVEPWPPPDVLPSINIVSETMYSIEHRPYKRQHESRFLALPGEVRNKIYFYLLTTCNDTLHRDRRERARGWRSAYVLGSLDLHPAILSTCRQIHHEAANILYANHVFGAHQSLLTEWPYLLHSGNPIKQKASVDRITQWWLCLRLDTEPRFDLEKVTKAFSGVESLVIEAWEAQFGMSGYSTLDLFSGVRGVKACKVVGSVRAPYARWLEGSMMSPPGSIVPVFRDEA